MKIKGIELRENIVPEVNFEKTMNENIVPEVMSIEALRELGKINSEINFSRLQILRRTADPN